MTPPPDPIALCGGCFLYETRGVCPAARHAYDLETPAEVRERAERLRLAIATDAHAARSFFERVLEDSRRTTGKQPLALPAAPDQLPIFQKEATHAASARTNQ
jgi:hypothetical protein